jgi:methyl-accepting chemotaxis protein
MNWSNSMLDRVTVNTLLKSVIVTMAGIIVVMLSMGAWNSWSRLQAASQIAAVTNASTYLFTASNHIGIDRSSTVRELVSDRVLNEPTVQMREARELLNPALKGLVPALEAIDFPDKSAAIAKLDRDIKKHIELQARTLAELKVSKAQRSPVSKDYLDLVASMIEQFDKMSAGLTMLIKTKDNYVDQLLQLKTHAWTIRNTGGAISIMLSNAVSGQALPPTAQTLFNYQLGRADAAWIGVEDVMSGMALPERLVTATNKVRQDFIGPDYVKARTEILNALLKGEKPKMTLEEWSSYTVPRNNLPASMATAALDIAKEYSAAQHSKALSTLIMQLALLATAIVVALGAMIVISRRVTGPLRMIREAMLKVATGDFSVVLPGLNRKDEIGDVANAVERFKVLAAEKAQQQADEALQRQQTESEQREHAAKTEAERTAQVARAEAELKTRAQEAEAAVQAKAAAERARIAEEQAHAVRALGEGLQMLADGDLTHRLDETFPAAYGQIKDDFNDAIERLQETIQSLVGSTQEVATAAAEISSSTTNLSQRTEEQAASLEETSASMEEISVTVRKNAENAQQANSLTAGTREVANRGGQVVSSTVEAMARIEDSSRKIADIIGVIDEIARQTNLLALNAAVEAARAGDAGRGFAVVASEVRSLAQRSSQAAKDIKDLISHSTGQVKDGVDLVNKTGASLNEIMASIKQVADIVADIATASTEQAAGIDQVNRALTQMDEATQQNSALVEENAATAKTLESQSEAMMEQASRFRVEGARAGRRAAA